MKKLSEKEISQKLKKIPGWMKQNKTITRLYVFKKFLGAIAFVNWVADEAEGMDHHPDIFIQYNKVRLTLSTHSAGGLTHLDFELARKVDR